MIQDAQADHRLSQGDIVTDVPFFTIPKAISLALHGEKGRIAASPEDAASLRNAKATAKATGKGLLAVELPIEVEAGIVISQDCDLDNKDCITVARLYPISAFAVQVKDALKHGVYPIVYDFIKRITEGTDYAHLLYVSRPIGDEIMCGDLLRVQVFPKKKWGDYFLANRVKCLTDQGLRYLQGRLSAFTGRFATDTGFWHSDEDRECASQIQGNRNLVTEAREELDRLKAAARQDPP